MKKLLLFCIFFMFASIYAQKMGNLAILPLKIDGQYKENKEETIHKLKWFFAKSIAKTKIYSVIPLENLRTFFITEKIDIRRFHDFEYRNKYLVKLFPKVQFCIEGELIFQTATTISASVRLIKVDNSAILKSTATHESIDNLEKLAKSLVEKLIPSEEEVLTDIKNEFIRYHKENNHDMASYLTEWALSIHPQHPLFLYLRGVALEKTGLYQEAENNFNEALRMGSNETQKIQEALIRLKPLVAKKENRYKASLENLFQKFEIFEKENYTQSIIDTCAILQNNGKEIAPLQKIIDESVKIQKEIADFILWMNRLHGSDVSEKNQKITEEMVQKIESFRVAQQKLIKAMKTSFGDQYPIFINRSIQAKKNKDYDQALLETDYAILLNDRAGEIYYHRGIALGKKYMYEESIEAFTTATKLNPKYWEAYYNRAMTYIAMDQKENALKDLLQTNQLFPYAQAYFEIAKIMVFQNKLKKALRNYGKAISLKEDFAEAHYERGKIYDQLNLHVLSSKDYEKAMKLDSAIAVRASPLYDKSNTYVKQKALIYLEIGQDHQKYGNLNEAISFYDKAIKLNNKLSSAFFLKGQILHMKEKYKDAVQNYSRVVEIDKAHPQVYIYRAMSWEYLKNYQSALQDAEKALEYNPNLPDVHQLRGRIYEQKKNYEEAFQSYDIAVKLLPSKSHYYLDRARMYEQLGNKNMAKQDRNHARSIK